MNSPFKFLDPFTLDDRDEFFGRDTETRQLYREVLRTRLLLLYGLSGTGKTSLIQCGLAGEFDGPDWLPLWIRRQSNINKSLESSIRQVHTTAEGTISEQIRQLYKHYLRPVYLIFDQFEELFILGDEQERETFASTLQEIMEEDFPCTIIMVIREEYLGRLYPIEKVLPNLFDFRMRVEPMNTKNVGTVLRESFRRFNIEVEGQEETEKAKRYEEIISKVSRERSAIELTDLQIYLDQFYTKDYERTYPDHTHAPAESPRLPIVFTKQEITYFGSIDDVLSRFMDEQKESIQARLKKEDQATPEDTVKFVLNGFVSPEGTKRPIKYTTTRGVIQIAEEQRGFFPALLPDPILSLCLSELERVKIIRAEGDYMELRHDNLAKKIYNERTAEQRKTDNLKIIIKAALDTPQGTREYLTLNQLAGFEEVAPQLDSKEKEFFEESIKYREQEKDAKLQKEKERNAILADERNKADEARKVAETAKNDADVQAQKTKRWLIVAVIAFIGSAIVGGYAFWQQNEAIIAKKNAERETTRADSLRLVSDKNLKQFQTSEFKAYLLDAETFLKSGEKAEVDSALKFARSVNDTYFKGSEEYITNQKEIEKVEAKRNRK